MYIRIPRLARNFWSSWAENISVRKSEPRMEHFYAWQEVKITEQKERLPSH